MVLLSAMVSSRADHSPNGHNLPPFMLWSFVISANPGGIVVSNGQFLWSWWNGIVKGGILVYTFFLNCVACICVRVIKYWKTQRPSSKNRTSHHLLIMLIYSSCDSRTSRTNSYLFLNISSPIYLAMWEKVTSAYRGCDIWLKNHYSVSLKLRLPLSNFIQHFLKWKICCVNQQCPSKFMMCPAS
jgi:hypothetical protein